MSETEGQFKGIRGFLWLAVGFLLLAAAVGSAIYIVVHLLDGCDPHNSDQASPLASSAPSERTYPTAGPPRLSPPEGFAALVSAHDDSP